MDNIYGDHSVKEIEHKGHTITVYQDDSPAESPRDWDNLGTMLCVHPRYDLGDQHDLGVRAIKRIVNSRDVISLPLYLHDHSGITMRTTPFGWPRRLTGRVGWIYVTKATVRAKFGYERVSPKRVNKVIGALRAEVEIYDLFLTKQVYGYDVKDQDGESIDSCWGFITDDLESVVEEAKATIS